ncbi:hypothetical protein ScPMuIL_013834 [Solemya velum]
MELPVADVTLDRGEAGLGFHIRGGVDTPYLKGETGIYITKIKESGAAFHEGTLKAGDKIVEVNGVNVEHVSHNEAVAQFVKAGSAVKLKVQRGARDEYFKQVERNRINSRQSEDSEDSNSSLVPVILTVTSVIGLACVVGFVIYRKRFR